LAAFELFEILPVNEPAVQVAIFEAAMELVGATLQDPRKLTT